MMIRIRFRHVFVLCVAVILLFTAFLVPGIAEQKKPQTGHVNYVSSNPVFYQRGGDCATQMAGVVYFKQTMYDSLVEADVNQVEIPALAKEWKIASDWSYIDFFLRDNVKFHNGAPVTAEDIKYSVETHMLKKNRWILGHYFRAYIKDIEIVGPHHIRFHMNNPFWGLLGRLWWGTGIFPKAYREKVGEKGFAANPIGAGPFKWTGDWKQDAYFSLEAVENHYRYTPEYKTLKIFMVPEASTRLAMLKSGEGDIVMLHPPHRIQVNADPNLSLLTNWYASGVGLVYLDLAFPKEPSPFHDERVRDAVSLAIDRKTICEKITFGAAKPWGSVLTPITLGFDPKETKTDPHNPEKAKKLLAEAGYTKGFDTVFNIVSTQKYYAEAIVSNLAEVGIRAKLKVWEAGARYAAFRSRKLRGFDIRISWYNAERHSSLYDGFMSTGYQVYHGTKEIDAAIMRAERAITDEDRIRTNRELEQVIKRAKLRAHLWTWSESFGIGPKIEYWEPKKGAAPAVMLEYVRLKR